MRTMTETRWPCDRSGRMLGKYGLKTRDRLLDAVDALIVKRTPWRQLAILDAAAEAGTSAPSFYQYFRNIETALFAAARRRLDAGEDLTEHFEAILALLAVEGWTEAAWILADAADAKAAVDA